MASRSSGVYRLVAAAVLMGCSLYAAGILAESFGRDCCDYTPFQGGVSRGASKRRNASAISGMSPAADPATTSHAAVRAPTQPPGVSQYARSAATTATPATTARHR